MVLKLQHTPESAGAPESPVKTHCWARPQFSDVGDPWGSPSLCLSSKRPGCWRRGLGAHCENRCLRACRWRSVSLPFPHPPGEVPSCHALVFQNAWNQPGCNFSIVDVFTVLNHYHLFSCSALSSNSAHHSLGACISFSSWFAGTLVAPTIHHLIIGLGPVLVCIPQSPAGLLHTLLHSVPYSLLTMDWIWTAPAFHLVALCASVKTPVKWSGASCYYKNREVITMIWDHIILGRKSALLSCFKVCVSKLKCFSDLASPRELKKKKKNSDVWISPQSSLNRCRL